MLCLDSFGYFDVGSLWHCHAVGTLKTMNSTWFFKDDISPTRDFHLQRHKTNLWEDVAVNGISVYVQSWIKPQSFESTPTRPLGSASASARLINFVSLVVRHSLSSTSLCFLQWNFGIFATGSSAFSMETEFSWCVIGKHLSIVVNLLQHWFAS